MIKTNMREIENLCFSTFNINKNKRLIIKTNDYKKLICWL